MAVLAPEELHPEQREDDDEEKQKKKKGKNGSHAVHQGQHKVPQ